MYKKFVFALVCSLVVSVLLVGLPAMAEVSYGDKTVTVPIKNDMETTGSPADFGTIVSKGLTQDSVQGDYAVMVTANSNSGSVEYTLASSGSNFNISEYSSIKLWIKPAKGAKWIQFFANNGTSNSLIKCDNNKDGKFEVGQDLISGKWNEVTLDLITNQQSLTQASALKVITNDQSIWLYDDISSVESSTISIDLSTMVNNQTEISAVSSALQFKPNSNGTYDTTPTTLISERSPSYIHTYSSQEEFTLGTHTNTAAVAGNIQISSSSGDWDQCTSGIALSGGYFSPYTSSNCFDNNTSTLWASTQSGSQVSGNAYIGYDFGRDSNQKDIKLNITYLRLKQSASSATAITSAKLQYSDDGVNFYNIQTLALLNNTSDWQGFIIDSSISARYWRLLANANPTSYWYVYELELYSPSDKVNYISPGINISSYTSDAQCVLLDWNGSNIQVKISLDNGLTWIKVEKGKANAEINGLNLTGKIFKYKVQLANPNGLLEDITVNIIGKDINVAPSITRGKITGIKIDSEYLRRNEVIDHISDFATYLESEKPTQFALSGNGEKLFYSNPNDSSKIYVLNLLSGESKKICDYSGTSIKVNYDGTMVAFLNSTNLYFYNQGTCNLLYSDVLSFDFQGNDTIFCYKCTGNFYLYKYSPSTGSQLLGQYNTCCLSGSEFNGKMYAITSGNLCEITNTPNGWKVIILYDATNDITAIKSNSDGSVVYLNISSYWYSFHISTKVVRRLNIDTGSKIVQVGRDNKIYIQDNNYRYLIYDPTTDTAKDISPTDAVIFTDSIFFNVNSTGNKMAYVAKNPVGSRTGVKLYYLNDIEKAERYLLSFDGKQSWHSCKDGTWVLASSEPNPTKTDFDGYGMTPDEVNALTEADFASLYANGRQIYSVDVAIYFTSTDIYTTPSIKSITVTVDNSLNDDGIGQSGPTLYAVKKQDFNITDCRKIKNIYPVELSPKAAEYYYFVKMDGNYKAWNSANNNWNTVANASTEGTYFNVQDNWITLTKDGMTAEELRNIPEAGLYSLLSAVNKTINIVYVMKVADESTEAYSSLINMDYVTEYFSGTKTILVITFNDGTASKQFTGLSESLVENFMEWLMGRQQNIGPIFYHLNNDFINYYMIQNVTAQ